ncbi:transposase [Acetivibrio saccincola]|nr:transposase [Acetivibrio saccincola]
MYLNRKVKRFWLSNIRKEVRQAVEKLSTQLKVEFPKEPERLLSSYVYREFKIHIDKDGSIKGGLLRLLFSLIDFTFVRSLIADCYNVEGGNCYDPVSLILLEVIKIWERYQYYPDFLKDLEDKEKGAQYRYYTGIDAENVPTDATLHNFRDRLGEEKFKDIMNFLVQIFTMVEIISGKILCTDGTLLKAFARYRGCNYMEDCCKCISCPESIVDDVNTSINGAVKEIEEKDKKSAVAVMKMQCPRTEIIQKIIEMVKKKDKDALIENIGTFSIIKLRVIKGTISEFKAHSKYLRSIFGESFKSPDGYSLEVISCAIRLDQNEKLIFECPKSCKDVSARIGYRRSKDNPSKTEKVFGYKAVIITSIEAEFNLEIPVAVITGSGNISEAQTFVNLHQELKRHVSFKTEYQVLDSGYDYEYVYSYIRNGNGKPIIDYNKRREKLDEKSMKKRGYNQNGYPYAPCGRVCTPNGFDSSRNALKNTCNKQCLKSKDLDKLCKCSYRKNKCGYTKWMTIKELPRLILEIPRGTKKYKKIKALRTSSERTNGYGKEWTGMSNLRLRTLEAYAARVALCCIVIMLKKIMGLILQATIEHRNPSLAKKLYNKKATSKLKDSA